MAKKIEGITIEIDGNTKKLNTALKSSNQVITATQKNVKTLDKLLKLDPKNVDLLKQKQANLKAEISATEEKLKLEKKAMEQMLAKADDSEEAQQAQRDLKVKISETEAELKKLGKEYDDVSVAAEQSGKKQIADAKKVAENNKKILKGIGKAVAVGFAGVTTIAGGVFSLAKKTASATDEIDKMSERLGLSREGYQKLDYVLSQSGVEINSFQTGMKSLTANMDKVTEGNKTAISNFEKLGVSVFDSNGKLKNQEQMLNEIIPAFQNMKNSTEKSRLAQELFGKQGQEILPLLNSQAGSYEELSKKAEEYGLVLSDDAINAGVKFTDTLDTLERSFQIIGTQIGAEFLPVVQDVADKIIDNMPLILDKIDSFKEKANEAKNKAVEIYDWIKGHKGLLAGIAITIGTITTAMIAYNTVQAISSAIQTAKTAVNLAETASLWSLVAAQTAAIAPYIITIAAIAALIAIIIHCIKNFDKFKKSFNDFKENATKKIAELKDNIKNTFTNLKNQALTWGKDMIQNFINGIKAKIQNLKESVNNIAKTISDRLHFSVPDKGPLALADTWMPDMVDLLSSGIDKGIPKLETKMNKLASAMSSEITTSVAMNPQSAYQQQTANGTNITGIVSLLNRYLPQIAKGQQVKIDSDSFLGYIDKGLGLRI